MTGKCRHTWRQSCFGVAAFWRHLAALGVSWRHLAALSLCPIDSLALVVNVEKYHKWRDASEAAPHKMDEDKPCAK